MTLRTLGMLLAATLLLTAPAAAQEVATAFPNPAHPSVSGSTTLASLVDGSLEQLTCDVDSWQLRLHRNFSADADVTSEQAPEIVTTLLMNGLSQVPSGGTLEIEYNDGSVSVWIPNERIAYDTERTAMDPSGNSYRIVTQAGKGSRMTADL